MSSMKNNLILAAAVAAAITTPCAFATNGMNMEGYGPVATGMGGASMAYDNGSAAVMNNPATLSLMADKSSRLDVAVGQLSPDVNSTASGLSADSSATSFIMPAVGWVKRDGQFAYGFGMFAQGGMGTEYGSDSFLAAGSGETVRSEVGVGRLIAPLSYNVDSNLTIGGSIDFVWAGMDLKMALSGAQFLDMAGSFGGTESYGSVSGSMMTAFGNFVAGGVMNPANPVNWGRFDFSNGNDFTGEAKGTGFAGKIGLTYKVNPQLTLGGVYHSKTALSDLKTSNATVSFNANVDTGIAGGGAPSGTYMAATIPLTGRIEVRNFEWPQMLGFGGAYQATKDLMVVADYKWINWKKAMKDFRMTFTADDTQAGLAAGFAGTELDATMYQNWKDQNVLMVGAAFKMSDPLTLRAGLNIANNPVPATYTNPLFPAIVKNHVTFGLGYAFDPASSVDASLVYAPEVKVTSGENVEISHSQTNLQVMYTARF
jgi:long-chain fatty acid transport protein